MEARLKSLFDYQRFAGNARLAALIEETQARCEGAAYLLQEEQLNIHAAGEENPPAFPKEPPDGKR